MDLINIFSSVVLAQHQSFTLQALVSTPLTLNQSKDIHVGSFLCKAGLFYPRKSLFPLLGYFFLSSSPPSSHLFSHWEVQSRSICLSVFSALLFAQEGQLTEGRCVYVRICVRTDIRFWGHILGMFSQSHCQLSCKCNVLLQNTANFVCLCDRRRKRTHLQIFNQIW